MALSCPECGSPVIVELDDMEEGDTTSCDDCGASLEIVSIDPPKVAVVDEAGYDDPEETLYHDTDEDEDA